MLSKAEIQRNLKTHIIGRKMFVFESLDSTNSCAKTLAETGTPAGTVVVADHQTAGRGRMGRSWVSEPGLNLLFSIVLRPSFPKESSGLLTFYSAVFIARALEKATGHSIECKWPNDILINGKKCCGILLENSFLLNRLDFSIIGIGVNVNQPAFEDSLAASATSLFIEFGRAFDRRTLLQTILREADVSFPLVMKNEPNKIMKEWNARCSMFGKPVTIANKEQLISGTALRLDPEGGLVIETPVGQSTYYAGDVTVIQ